MLTLVIIIGIVLTIGIIAAGILLSRRGGDTTQERLGQFVGGSSLEGDEDQEKKSKPSGTSLLTQNLDQVIEERGLGKNLATELARADLKITVAEFWALNLMSIVGMTLLAFLIYGGFVMPLIGAVAGFFIPKFWLKMRQRARLNKFNNQLGDGISLMANGLRSGYSLLQAMDAVGREMPEPMAIEFKRVVREVGLGLDNDRAFVNLLRRVPSDDLDLMITAINVQHEIGGNLAEILEIIGFVIRERVRIKGEIQVLTAQGQLSGYIISGLPVALGLLLYAMNQAYIGKMVFSCDSMGISPEKCTQPCGWIMIGAGVLMIASGFFAIQKIIAIEV
ncbi:MAG: type II secretion system F family protein [Chloroflexi bacterium]|nr:type II secretion system F family protein [Chloroflexota bacterium]